MAVESRPPPIFRLPADILAELMDSCTPLSFFNLASTCKHLAALSEPVLSRNRDAHRRFRYASDLDPMCMPALVRSVVLHQDPVVAHFARSIDIWGTRSSWDEWRRYEVDERGVHMRGDVVDFGKFEAHEVRRLLALTRELLGEGELDAAREEFENGADGLLNFLVIASCPCLDALKFIRRNDVLQKSCQRWLEKSIRHISSREAEWPAGLKSIRDAAFSVDAGILDEHIQVVDPDLRPDLDGAHSLAAFMRLPAIEALYYRTELLLGDEEAEYQEPDYDPAFLIDSSVKHVFIDNISGTAAITLESFYGAPVALETLAMRFSLDQSLNNVDESLELLAESQAKSLKQLMFYNPEGLCGYRTDSCRPENIQQFQGLKLWYQSIQDVELQALYDNGGESPSREDIMGAWTRYMLPETEVLILNTTNDPGVILARADRKQAWDFHDEALAAMIRESAYPKRALKALFVPSPKDPNWGDGKQGADSCAIPKTVKMGQDLGVDVYIAGQSTGTSPKKHILDFPMAVTKWDIPSGPSYGKRVEDGFVAFEPVSGTWMKQVEEDMGYYIDAAARR